MLCFIKIGYYFIISYVCNNYVHFKHSFFTYLLLCLVIIVIVTLSVFILIYNYLQVTTVLNLLNNTFVVIKYNYLFI